MVDVYFRANNPPGSGGGAIATGYLGEGDELYRPFDLPGFTGAGFNSSDAPAGYTFVGWGFHANDTPDQSFLSVDNAFSLAEATLYAVWKQSGYTVTYNGNGFTGGSVPTNSNVYAQNASVPVTYNSGNLVRGNYVFKGWTRGSSAPAVNSTPEFAVSGTTVTPNSFIIGSASVTLYAVWWNTYTVTYNGNGFTGGSVPTNSTRYEQNSSVPVTHNSGNLVRTNYVFKGWTVATSAPALNATPQHVVSGTTVTPNTFTISNANATIYAVWGDPTYTVTYNGNGSTGGTVPNNSNTYAQNASVPVTHNSGNLVRTNHRFMGWTRATSAPAVGATPQHTVSGTTVTPNTFTMGTANVTIYAVWARTYTVTYNVNGGTGTAPTDPNSPYLQSATVTVRNLGSVSRPGYTFLGWATTSGTTTPTYTWNGSAFSPSTFTMGTANVILYAIWQQDTTKYNVTYNANGGTGAPPVDSNSPYTAGSTVTVLGQGSLTRTDYVFKGWATTSSATTAQYTQGNTFTMGSSNMILYAVWNPTYTLTYSDNGSTGGTVPTNSNRYEQGASVPVTHNIGNLVKTNFTFKGWSTASNATTPTYAVTGTNVSPSSFTMGNANVTLHAVWEQAGTPPIDNEIIIHDSSGDGINDNTISVLQIINNGTYMYTRVGIGFIANATRILTSMDIKIYREGIFSSQIVAKLYLGTYNNAPHITLTGSPVATSTPITWDSIPTSSNWVNFKFNNNYELQQNNLYFIALEMTNPFTGASIQRYIQFILYIQSGAPSAYRYDHNVSNWTRPSSNQQLRFILYGFTPSFSVTYNANGASGGTVPNDSGSYAENASVSVLPNSGNLVRSGFVFMGWSLGVSAPADNSAPEFLVSGPNVIPSSFNMGSANVVLFAVWWSLRSMSYNGNGNTSGLAPVDPNSPYVNGASVAFMQPGDLARLNHTFGGWANTASASSANAAIYSGGVFTPATFNITANITRYAFWVQNPQYTVSYNGNGHLLGAPPLDVNSPYWTGSTVTVLGKGSLVREGYTFEGWSTDQFALSPAYVENNTFTISSNVTLYAVWKEIIFHTLTYDGNGHTGGDVPVDNQSPYVSGSTVTVLGKGSLTKTNYTFLGWAINNSLATMPDLEPDNTFTLSQNVVLYAVWEENPKYQVTYHANTPVGFDATGSVPTDSNLYYEGATVNVAANPGSLEVEGYDFLGWAVTSNAVEPDFDVEGSTVDPATFYMGSQNVTLFAVWKLKPVIPTYMLEYNANWPQGIAGTGNVPIDNNSPYEAGDQVTVLHNTGNLVKLGWIFLGWSPSSNATTPSFQVTGNIVNPPTFNMPTSNLTLYAVWEKDLSQTGTIDQTNPPTSTSYLRTQHPATQPPAATNASSANASWVKGNGMYLTSAKIWVSRSGTFTDSVALILRIYNRSSTTNSASMPLNEPLASSEILTFDNTLPTATNTFTEFVFEFDGKFQMENEKTYFLTIEAIDGAGLSNTTSAPSIGVGYITGQLSTERCLRLFSVSATSEGLGTWNTGSTNTSSVCFVLTGSIYPVPSLYGVVYEANFPFNTQTTGTAPMDNMVYVEHAAVGVKNNSGGLAVVGYNFLGWAYVADATLPDFTVNSLGLVFPSTFNMGTSNVTLYGVWTKLPTYNITYHSSGHTSGLVPVDFNNPYLTGSTATIFSRGSLSRTNFVFKGWSTNSVAASVTHIPGQVVTLTGNLDLYAVWSEHRPCSVTYEGNGATLGSSPVDSSSPYHEGVTITLLGIGSLARANHTFIGWRVGSAPLAPIYQPGDPYTLGSTSVVLFAVWQENPRYSIAYFGNSSTGGNAPADLGSPYYVNTLVSVLSECTLYRTGYVFAGWATSPNGTVTYVPGNTFSLNHNVELYAVWQALPTYTVTYMSNGATDGQAPLDPNTYYEGIHVTLKNNEYSLERSGHKLLGWSIISNASIPDYALFGSIVIPPTFLMPSHGVVLYAVWQKIDMYTLTYHANRATSGSVPQNQNIFMADSIVSVRPNLNNLQREGYTFIGWAYTDTATVADFVVLDDRVYPPDFIISVNVELHAVWELRPRYTVTYHANGASIGSVPQDENRYYLNDTVTIQHNTNSLARDDYEFIGWMYNSQFFLVQIDNTVIPDSLTLTGNIDFFAVWKPVAEEPNLCVHYGTIAHIRELCLLYLEDGAIITDETIDRFRCLAAGWVNAKFEPYQTPLPLKPAPNAAHHASDLYAAGRYLQPRTPEEKTHPYIENAEKLLNEYLEKAQETGLLPKNVQPYAIAIGIFTKKQQR